MASLSAALGGSTFVFTRILVDSVDPFTLSFLRYGLTGLILFLLSINIFYKKKFDRFDLIPMSLLGLAMISLFPNFMALGLEHTTASRAGLLYATMPLCTIIIAFFFKIEKITTNKSLAVVIAISGVSFCMSERVEGNFGETLKGDLLMMIGVIAASCFTVFSGKYLKKYGNAPVMVFVIFVGSVINLFVALILGTGLENSYNIGHLEVIAFLMLIIPGGVLMMFCWGKALQLISPTQAAISLGFNPLSAILLGYIILNEQITFKLVIGFVSIIFAIVLANWKSSKS
ncbi:MAG: DMT family transporter [Proteobacteria bacterium]|nr:DMT family transporter [Pseudomonadota bacterium]